MLISHFKKTVLEWGDGAKESWFTGVLSSDKIWFKKMLTFLGGKRWAFLSVCFILRSNAFMTTEYELTNDIIDSDVICWLFLCDYCKSRAAQFLTVSAVKTKNKQENPQQNIFLNRFFCTFAVKMLRMCLVL